MSDLGLLWRRALAPVQLRHPNGRSEPIVRVIDGLPLRIFLGLDEATCTKTGAPMPDFSISTVELSFWPGVHLAQLWLAAAWVGYLQHEALELVTINGRAVLDPHAEPYGSNPVNRGLRDGLPLVLTPETLQRALEIVMSPRLAAAAIALHLL